MNTFEKYQKRAAQLLTDPDDPTALCDQVAALETAGQHSPASLALIRRAATIAPDEFFPVFNLGSVLSRDGKYREALRQFLRSLDLARRPDQTVMALHHIGMMHNDMGQNERAIQFYDMALALAPDDKDIGQSRAISRLFMGELREGLHEFEVRLHKPARKAIYSSGIPVWKGEELNGKTLIVTHEQGYGDTLQFIRFLRKLITTTAVGVIFSGPPGLNALLEKNVIADAWIDEDGPFNADYICSLMAMTAHLGIEYRDVTGEAYMKAEPFALPDRGALKIGIVWQGSYSYSQNARRSMFLDDLCPLFAIPGAAFYSLQVGPGAKEISKAGLDGFIADLTCKIKDWSDTARAIMAMDVIVGVDTGTMHLAGALGKRALMMLPYAPCWRWLRERSDTPWYRNTKLYRQSIPGTWPINAVKTELERMVHERRQAAQGNCAWSESSRALQQRSVLECV